MHCLHPDDDQNREFLFRTLFPPNEDDSLKNIITSSEFKLLLKKDATTTEGLQYVANYFGMRDSVDWTGGNKDALQQYHQLLFNIKEAKTEARLRVDFILGKNASTFCYYHGTSQCKCQS